MLRSAGKKAGCAVGGVRRMAHSLAQPAPLQSAIDYQINTSLPPLIFPEDHDHKNVGVELPNFPFFDGAMELMAVPKKKVSRHKRGIRNGPKALKPVPVIIRCTGFAVGLSYRTSFVAVGSNKIPKRVTATTRAWASYMIMSHDHVAGKLYVELKKFEEYNGSIITRRIKNRDPKGISEDDVLPDGTKAKAGGMVTYRAVIGPVRSGYLSGPLMFRVSIGPGYYRTGLGRFSSILGPLTALVTYIPYSMGRMEYNRGPDAASFKPERWLKDGIFQNASPFKFTAFQVQFYEFKLVQGHQVKYRMMTILSMENGLKITVSKRA
ncbi:hypothetical protein OROGR_001366 [Orobanche gracilis]